MSFDAQTKYLSTHPSLSNSNAGSKLLWLKEILAPVFPRNLEANILEIGPGRGEALQMLAFDFGYVNVEAVDNSQEVVDLCRKLSGVNVELVLDLTTFLTKNKSKYEMVLMYHVLEHFETNTVVQTLSTIREALAPGGVLVIGVPNAAAPIIGPDQQYFDFTHKTAFSPWSLEQALRMAGFEDIRVRPIWPPRGGVKRAIQRSVQKTLVGLMRMYLKLFTGVPRPVLTHSMVAYARPKNFEKP